MADYFNVIKRTVINLSDNSPNNRRLIYGRAREALLKQLRAVTPSLSDTQITRQRMALERAIREVENEFGQVTHRRRSDAGPETTRQTQTGLKTPAPANPIPSESIPSPVVDNQNNTGSERKDTRDGEEASSRSITHEENRIPSRPPERNRDSAAGIHLESHPVQAEMNPEAALPEEVADDEVASTAVEDTITDGESDLFSENGDLCEPTISAQTTRSTPRPTPHPRAQNSRRSDPLTGRDADRSASSTRPGQTPNLGKKGIVLLAAVSAVLLTGIALVVFEYYDGKSNEMVAELVSPSPEAALQSNSPSADRPDLQDDQGKSEVRLNPSEVRLTPNADADADPGSQTSSSLAVPGLEVAYLIEEGQGGGQQRIEGQIQWKLNQSATDTNIVGNAYFPEANLTLSLQFNQNSNVKLPASHLITFNFFMENTSTDRRISGISAPILKRQIQDNGSRLTGVIVPLDEVIADNNEKTSRHQYLMGLAGTDSARIRNLPLLKEREWIDIPLIYRSGLGAVIAIAKGETGERVFLDAFNAWGQ